MKYRMQIYIEKDEEWCFVNGPSDASAKEYVPYEYDTHAMAYRMLNMSYPNLAWGRQKRVTDAEGNVRIKE